jgi:ATP-dependent phosphoenolpyruvate carboxykinase
MNILFDNKKHPDFQELIKTYKNRLAYYTQHIKEKSDRDLIVVAEWVNTHEEIQFAIDL